MAQAIQSVSEESRARGPLRRGFDVLARRWPFTCLFGIAVFSNVAASLFSIGYNWVLIVSQLSDQQKIAFRNVTIGNNLVMFTLCLSLVLALFRPLAKCRRHLLAGQKVEPQALLRCQRMLINLPMYQLGINLIGWLPGAIVFPLGICLQSGWNDAGVIWAGFGVSFVISALLATFQTFFFMEAFELHFLFGEFFAADRPTQTSGVFRIPLKHRFMFYWFAAAVVPLLALLAVALHERASQNKELALAIAIICLASSAVLGAVTGRTLLGWVESMNLATNHLTKGDFAYRIPEKRPGDFGRLTDMFNDMAEHLEIARHVRDTFGQFVSPELLDRILQGELLGGKVQEVTVLFADIRGFTQRTLGEDPKKVVDLLNRFLTLCVAAVENQGGWVNKFLGDGIMGLFGAPLPQIDHADSAVAASCDLLARLDRLNSELLAEGAQRLEVGIGLHTGLALVGSIGASLPKADGPVRTRREFTAIGETVNYAQRIEQLTKSCGGPILISEETRRQLKHPVATADLGSHLVAGSDKPVAIHRIEFVGRHREPAASSETKIAVKK